MISSRSSFSFFKGLIWKYAPTVKLGKTEKIDTKQKKIYNLIIEKQWEWYNQLEFQNVKILKMCPRFIL